MSFIKTILDLAAKLRPSTIEFVTSDSFELTGDLLGVSAAVTLEGIKVKDNSNGDTQWLNFAGLGGGVGVGTPIGGSFSREDFPSFGSSILRGTYNWGKLEIRDLTGLSRIVSISNTGVDGTGVCGSLIFFGVSKLYPPPLPPLLFEAALWVEGAVVGVPGAGLMMYTGWWARDDSWF